MTPFEGIYPALVTPLTSAGNLNEAALEKLVEFHAAAGVDGLYLGGTTGEGLLLDLATRQRLVERVVSTRGGSASGGKCARGRLKVIVHVAACSTDDAVALARYAEEAGADAVSAIPPVFYKIGFDGVHEYYRRIAAATRLPFYVYYIPALSGLAFSIEELGRLFALPNVAGVKFSDYNLFLLHALRERYPEKIVFSGEDQVFLPALVMGAHGAIGLTLNLMPRLYVALYRAFRSGNLAVAQRLQFQANRVIEVVIRHGSIAAAKAIMGMLGVDCGPCRGPLATIAGPAYDRLRQDLEQVGFFDAVFIT
ncbi:MAG: dihydrodipicolinate synthase family protein [Lentisphaerae bacterium]|nr:dihydrodipicolinate synthase family protein [Lentisphaerota bacterium]